MDKLTKYDLGLLSTFRISWDGDNRTPEEALKREKLPYYSIMLREENQIEASYCMEHKTVTISVNGHFVYGRWANPPAGHPEVLTNQGFVDIRFLHSGLVLRAIPRDQGATAE